MAILSRSGLTAVASERDEWCKSIHELIDGVARRLCRSAPKSARVKLAAFRERVDVTLGARARTRFERELDMCLEDTAYFRAAARRHIRA